MGYCKDCTHYYEYERESIFDLTPPRCIYLDRDVSPYGSCSHFAPKPVDDYHSGGCFLTSACVDYLGKEDDCVELTKLRAFRDTYMKASDYGSNLVKEYYEVAPEIVRRINSSSNRAEFYEYINCVIADCVADIDNGNNGLAMEKYVEMVRNLQQKLL